MKQKKQQKNPEQKITKLEKELALKSSELKIETALEKVRTIAMRMKKPDDMLDVCKTIALQLKSLGVQEIRNVQTAIFYKQRGTYMNYEYYAKHNKKFITETSYTNHKMHKAFARKMLKGKGEFFVTHIKGKKVKDWIAYQKTTNVFIDKYLKTASSVNYYWYSLGPVALGISTYLPLTQEEIILFKRFLKVFELAYLRYLDIELAETQAREAQIEASLERVRAQAMGMNKPADLLNVCDIMYGELYKLGFDEMRNAMINIHNDDKKTFLNYDYSDEIGKSVTLLDYNAHPVMEKQIKQSRKANDAFSEAVYKGKDLIAWKKFRRKYGEKDDPRIKNISALHYYFYSIGNGTIGISTFSPINEEKLSLLKRFRNVFSLAYQRYSDISLAEAQAREAQIELALERIRARTMAMHKSDELSETAYVLFEQFRELGENPDQLSIGTVNEVERTLELWLAVRGNKFDRMFKVPIDEPIVINKIYTAWKRKNNSFVLDVSGDELKKYNSFRNSIPDFKDYNKVKNSGNEKEQRRVIYCAFFKSGLLSLATPEPRPEETLKLLERFAGVFDLTYTRFLDLQKAEAQAREAQIETALEKVRAVAMGMNKPDDIINIGNILFNELRGLGFNNIRNTLISIFNDDGGFFLDYDYSDFFGGSVTKIFYNSHPIIEDFMIQIKKANDTFAEIEVNRKQIKGWEEFRKKIGERPDPRLKNINSLYYYIYSIGSGSIGISNFEKINDVQREILKRFRNVFNLAYKRYSDISLAEAQAREAQIEAALERVRAKAMAMHSSNDLSETMGVLFTELPKLDISSLRCGVVLLSRNSTQGIFYAAATTQESDSFTMIGGGDMKKHPVFMNQYENWLRKENYFVTLSGEDLRSYYKEIFARLSKTYNPKEHKVQTEYGYYFAFSEGMFYAWDEKPYSEDEINILNRFKAIIDLTFRRYLDLKKAEAQAREAQIEMCLERVRARTMAMQKSEELKEVIKIVFQQLTHLKINLDHSGFVVDYTPRGDWHFWIADERDIPSKITHPYFESVWANQFDEAKEKGLDFFTSNLNFEEKNKFYNELLSYVPGLPEASKEFYLRCPGLAATTVLMDNVALYIENFSGIPYSDEENSILLRFGKVFQQTYTRFLDLQKAEAQAREAKIETALERVRSRTMAMHKSEELLEVIIVVSQQLLHLEFKFNNVSFGKNSDSYDFDFWVAAPDVDHPFRIYLPYLDSPVFNRLKDAQLNGDSLFVDSFSPEETKEWMQHLLDNNDIPELTPLTRKFLLSRKRFVRSAILLKNIFLFLINYDGIAYSDKENEIIVRFAKAFEQAYIRFLDLQTAEAQARENQIELALERVRASAMAMHNSNDVGVAAAVMFTELEKLGIETIRCGIDIMDKSKIFEVWASTPTDEGKVIQIAGKLDSRIHPHLQRVQEAWERQEKFTSSVLEGQELEDYYKKLSTAPDYRVPETRVQSNKQFNYDFFFKEGGLFAYRLKQFTEEEILIMQRFASVFGLTFRRYLDLKKAEAQAREAQIEASLERVRAVAMSMRKSDDLLSICEVSFKEFKKLGFDNLRNSLIHILNDEKEFFLDYDFSDFTGGYITKIFYKSHPIVEDYLNQIKSAEDAFAEVIINGEQLNDWKAFRLKTGQLDDPRLNSIEALYYYGYSIGVGDISISTFSPIDESQIQILKRFRNVFDLAYRRYVDIIFAEAQVRESQIQLALERIRARTMAMHKSDELSETSYVLFQQFVELGIVPNRFFIGIMNEDDDTIDMWITEWGGTMFSQNFKVNVEEPIMGRKLYGAWKRHEKTMVVEIGDKDLVKWNEYLNNIGFPVASRKNVTRLVNSCAIFSKGFIAITTPDFMPAETLELLERFAAVFNLTYTRFLDLQKAEAQAREAKIEASLEKVRAKAMSMHTPEDLSETVSLFFKELKSLNVLPWRCGVGRIDEETRTTFLTTTSITKDGKITEVSGKLKQTGHPILDGIFDHWKMQKEYYPVLSGEEINKYYSIIKPQIAYPDYPLDAVQYGHNIPFKEGFIFAWTENRLSEDELQIFRRFSSVLSLTYRRYMDLKEAEARASESVRQASLDRVRAEIASMRTSEDLNRITPVIWRELKTLGVPFFRCGVYIIDEKTESVHVYLTTPDGKSLGVLHLSFNSNEITYNTVENWKKKEVFKTHWNKEEFISWTKLMMEIGQIQNAETYQGSTEPPESLYLHFVPFPQGMLYVGDVQPLTDEKLELVKTLAEAFSIAYARYEDFRKLEEAKNKIEVTLNELKAAQAQLVHSEKMASLGELTAGIAHEIKNPLNFVNNFSEVSRELLDEMKTEIQNKNIDEVIELIEDLKQNLDKINQHGKRADSIVKGMLLHSRGSSGKKSLTDINDLLDQYVNLAYHGMRAQNKEFNITIEKDYDKTLDKFNVVPQDISRVFLNIINNACYAAYERKRKSSDNNFSPTLKISTKNLKDKIEIKIGDNGNGIPADHLDKIFQPFFTTKPTGEGTGLGLSLSYDIVTKVHGGELNVETIEGKGTEFIIILNN